MVPILIQPHVLKAMDVLMAHRKDLGKNKFFFASHSANSHLYSCAVLRSMTKRAGLERQDLLTSTSLRKYVATAAQVRRCQVLLVFCGVVKAVDGLEDPQDARSMF